ncbi:MAG: hypothetical protein MRZ66_03560 [Clostridiales bacterium]|nr:hypothetical protein [Clostridiales bacterium]
MMFKKVKILIIGIIVIIVLCTLLIVCAEISFLNPNDDNQIKIAIYPSSGGPSHTYYFVINPDTGKMLVKLGVRSREEIDFTKNHFMMGGRRFETEKEKVYLSSDEVDEIINLLDLIYADENLNYRSLVADSWGIAIYYNNSVVQNNSYYDSDKLQELIDILRDKTSIEMKFQGFA